MPLEVDNAPPGAAVEVMLGRLSGGAFVEVQSARREGGRDRRVGFALVGSALHFEATMRDWTVRLVSSSSGRLDYRASIAQWKAELMARRPKTAKLAANQRLRDYVQDRLAGLIQARDGTPYVLEVNGIPGWQGLQEATGIDVAGALVDHVARREP